MTNLVTTTPTRFTVIRPELLPEMKVLESLDTETIIAARLAKFKELWTSYDPPNGAIFDVDRLEFDPIVIHEELAAYFEVLVRDRVNQACRAVTLANAVGSDLDALGSNYPYGCPRLDLDGDGEADEPDDAYRTRIWLSPNILSLGGPGQGNFESYAFWALSAPMPSGETTLKHATCMTVRSTGNVYVAILPAFTVNETWVASLDGKSWTLAPGIDPKASTLQRSAVYEYITEPGTARMGLTDVLYVTPAKITDVAIDAEVWLFPGVDATTMMKTIRDSIVSLIKALGWLGSDLTDLALKGALAQAGVYKTKINSPTGDVTVPINGFINVTSVKLTYKGSGE